LLPPKTRVKVVSLTNPRLARMGLIGLRGIHSSSRQPDRVVFLIEVKMNGSSSGLGPRGAKLASEHVVAANQFLPEHIRASKA
jgi:hypothetical protein